MKDNVIQCEYCGDSCGQSVCYNCEDIIYSDYDLDEYFNN